MSRRRAAGVVLALLVLGTRVSAHAGLRFSSPLENSTLGAAPSQVQLTFVERPEVSLATIRVLDTTGNEYQVGRPDAAGDDPLTLVIKVRPLDKGVYTVYWRVVSAVDGHVSAGAFVFGVLMDPAGARAAAVTEVTGPWLEAAGRSVFLIGLVLAIGSAAALGFRFGDSRVTPIAAVALALTFLGLVVLAAAQARAAQAGVLEFARTSIGRNVLERALGLVPMLAGLAWIRIARGGSGRVVAALLLFGGATWCAVAHAMAGHAAAARWPAAPTIAVQSVHILFTGAWLGGLAVLIAELRARPNPQAITRFSNLAAVSLVIVAMSGGVRAFQETGSWPNLLTTSYGWLAIAKGTLLVVIAGLGALNRWRHMTAAAVNPDPLRRTAIAEVNLAILATIAAAILGTLPPPAGADTIAGMSATASDFATTVRATFSATSNQPGPNRFTVQVEDYDSAERVLPDRVSLTFTPIDDPGIESTTLALARDGERGFVGTGANLAFPGRWRVAMLIERAGDSVTIPVEVEARGRPQFTSVVRPPNQAPTYAIESSADAYVSITVDPEKAGRNVLQISFANVLFEPLPVTSAVVTLQHEANSVQPLVITREDRHRFSSTAVLQRGRNVVVVTARSENGSRVRATLELLLTSGN